MFHWPYSELERSGETFSVILMGFTHSDVDNPKLVVIHLLAAQ